MYSPNNEVKVALVGETGVGKTCIAIRFISNSFNIQTPSTSGAAFMRKTVLIDNQAVKFQIWDTAGQEKFRSLTPMYYRSASAVIIVYDVTRTKTFEDVKYWVNEIQVKGQAGASIHIVGNKLDKEGREVQKDTAETYAKSIKATYCECSAMTGEGVEDIFTDLGKKKIAAPSEQQQGIKIIPNDKTNQKKFCC